MHRVLSVLPQPWPQLGPRVGLQWECQGVVLMRGERVRVSSRAPLVMPGKCWNSPGEDRQQRGRSQKRPEEENKKEEARVTPAKRSSEDIWDVFTQWLCFRSQRKVLFVGGKWGHKCEGSNIYGDWRWLNRSVYCSLTHQGQSKFKKWNVWPSSWKRAYIRSALLLVVKCTEQNIDTWLSWWTLASRQRTVYWGSVLCSLEYSGGQSHRDKLETSEED